MNVYGFDKLINDFLNREISADQFEALYRERFLNDLNDADEELFLILDELYVYVYGYTRDENLLKNYSESHFDEGQLRMYAAKALREMLDLNNKNGA